MAKKRDSELRGADREEIARAARDPEQAKKEGAKLFGAGMTTPDSTQIPYTSEGEPDERARGGKGSSPEDESESGDESSERR